MYLLTFSFLMSGIVVWLATFAVRTAALQYRVIAKQDLRRRHDREVPLMGGTGFYLVFTGITLIFYSIGQLELRFCASFIAALSIVYAIGMWDDCKEIKALPKFLGQLVASLLMVYAEPNLPTVLGGNILPTPIVIGILLIWTIGVMNAMNFIDGLDGLCTGTAGITALTLAAITVAHGTSSTYPIVILIAMAGASVGFLMHNFNPAKIFLGDSGSLLLGFVLAVFSAYIDVKRSLFISLSVPIFLLCLPLIDLLLAIVRRSVRQTSIFKGDHSHIHHRLQQIGLTHRGTVIVMWTVTAYLNFIAFTLASLPTTNSLYIYLLTGPVLSFLYFTLRFIETRLSHQISSYSHLFLEDWQRRFSDKGTLISKIEQDEPFLVFLVDYELTLQDIAQRSPGQVVNFFIGLYKALKISLRKRDFIVQISEFRIAAIVSTPERFPERLRSQLEDRIIQKLKLFQKEHRIFSSDLEKPEGLTVLEFPKDAEKLISLIDLEKALTVQKRAS